MLRDRRGQVQGVGHEARLVMREKNDPRLRAYRKDATIEQWMRTLNERLDAVAADWRVPGTAPEKPIVFLVGLQRSGTTLLMQLLVHCFRFTYADNIVARFWRTPFIGVIVSRNLRQQCGSDYRSTFRSDYGVTEDLFGPHEFGYFWTRWFGFEPTHELREAQLARVDIRALRRSLFLMEHYGGDPLLFKAVPLSLNAGFVAEQFPTALFVYLRRSLLYVAQSTYLGRIRRYGDAAAWWSLKPALYEQIRNLPPIQQVAAQVYHCDRKIRDQLAGVPRHRVLTLDYEALCRSPGAVIARFRSFAPHMLPQATQVPDHFENRDVPIMDPQPFNALREALRELDAE